MNKNDRNKNARNEDPGSVTPRKAEEAQHPGSITP
jgi:hypothetical protein